MGRLTDRRRIVRLDGEERVERVDTLVREEPLEIRFGGEPVAVTMRTPGDDFDLVAGFCWTEGLIDRPDHLASLRYCTGAPPAVPSDFGSTAASLDAVRTGGGDYNVIDVGLAAGARSLDLSLRRSFYTTSSCGLCGKASIDALRVRAPFDLSTDDTTVSAPLLAAMPGALRHAQRVFDRTGGLHAAGLFDAAGRLLCLREDVGRHNAVDKVVGWALRAGSLPLTGKVLLVSGRASFELAQKALIAGAPVLAAVSAASTLAVELAADCGMTLVGFLRGASMNVYTGAGRITAAGGRRDAGRLLGDEGFDGAAAGVGHGSSGVGAT